MTSRPQLVLDAELQRRARARSQELGISFAEYIRRLVSRDLGSAPVATGPSVIFNLGDSANADIAGQKDQMTGEAIARRSVRSRR